MDSLLERWRLAGQGWSQLICDPLLQVAFGHLEPAVGTASTVLDLGCGWGHVAGVFADGGCGVVGLDPDDAMLRITGERHPAVARIQGSA
ncbi:MAG TPA: class I SAM-dependent methyltransferase, partial [Longimicrobiaceae bacterium]|nr:class I SAM-dependent methyltransferase [Longimicrobiaceae bacterium]